MSRWRKWLAVVPAVALALAACGDETAEDPATEVPEVEEAEDPAEEDAPDDEAAEGEEAEDEPVVRADADLVIWADDTRTPALQNFANEFSAENEVEVALQEVSFDDIRDRLITAGPAGEGPDIIIGAHDWLGELVENGVVAPVDLAPLEGDLAEVAVQAFTFDGQTYGLPYATENVGLFRNTDLVPEAPATWEEVEETALALQDAGDVRQGIVWPSEPADPYHNYPIVTAYGGYVFGMDDDGTYDPSDLGIDSPGGIEAANKFAEMIESGVMSPDISYQLMIELFSGGDAAFAITGPWALADFPDTPFEVSPIPPVDGGTPAPFVGVQGFMVSAFAENELLAQTFLMDYMATTEAQVALYEVGNRPPALLSAFDEVADDPNIEAFGEAGIDGVPMPAIAEMGSVWEAWTDAYTLIYEGEQEPEQAFRDAAEQIRSLID
jgi:arabinogalactan oligomer / maltooligosaccharide transport system substrate-binding protein